MSTPANTTPNNSGNSGESPRAFYKVLNPEGRSFHGGFLKWSLPQGDEPGAWHEVKADPQLCSRGLHLTDAPVKWHGPGCRVFVVEIAEDAKRTEYDEDGCKIAVTRCRLVRELSAQELCDVGIVREGCSRSVADGELVVVEGGTIESVWGGTIKSVWGGTIESVRGGTIKSVWGGTIESVWGGTIESVWGGTIKSVRGGTIKSVRGGTIESVRGGTIESVWGERATVIIYYGKLPERIGELCIVVDRRRSGAPCVITTADVVKPEAAEAGK